MTVNSRIFKVSDAAAVAALVAHTLRVTNRHDYFAEYIENDVQRLTAAYFIKKAQATHFYVFYQQQQLVGVGAIGPYWNKTDEMSLFNIFVALETQGQGIGRQIMQTLAHDSYFKQAKRIEIPASITALKFYQKFGYQFKAGHDQPDAEQLYRLEKWR